MHKSDVRTTLGRRLCVDLLGLSCDPLPARVVLRIREALEMTQAELVAELGKSESAVWYWEAGRRECRGAEAKLLRALERRLELCS